MKNETIKLFEKIKKTISKRDLMEGINNLNDFVECIYFMFYTIENGDEINWVELFELVEANDF